MVRELADRGARCGCVTLAADPPPVLLLTHYHGPDTHKDA
jgi:hypothetical protein